MSTISAEVVEARIKEFGRLWTIDDLIRVRAQDEVQCPILGYPKYDDKPTDYEYFTGKELDRMVDETCHLLVRAGLETNSPKTVALFAQSDLSYVVTLFALSRLGCETLIMSIRLGEPACLNLLATAECDTVLYGSTARIASTVADLKKANANLHFLPVPVRADFDKPDQPSQAPFVRPIADREAEHVRVSMVMHSSGSTGLPKPLFLSHRSLITTLSTGTGLRAFNTLPWYHIHGLFTSLMAMWMRRPAHLFNARLPLTADNVIRALREARPEICHTVPYCLKLMAERGDGMEVLRGCRYVTSAGARTPDELGDRVVEAGVRLGVIYGMTEVGHVGDSLYREPGDDTWDYVRPYASLRPHMVLQPRGGGEGGDVYEAVYLKTHPALKTSNSDDPPGSFHSRDLWTPHPTLPDAWKFVARDDDTVTLLSGEKILPLGIEGAIRESPLVRDALVVGNDRLAPGVLVFRAVESRELSDDEFVDAVWPFVEAGNRLADEFARITRDMVVPVPADVGYPATDKNNIIRGAAYAKFADYIDAMYEENPQTQANGGDKKTLKKFSTVDEIRRLIMDLLRDQVDVDMADAQTDFFAVGVDSLRAAQIRRLLLQNVDIGDHSLPTNAIYDAGNVETLAQRLHSMSLEDVPSNGDTINGNAAGNSEGDLELMQKLVDEYGSFERRKPGDLPNPEKETVILTGATGALGAHLLHLLLQDPQIDKIYCLVRSSSNNSAKDAIDRVQTSLHTRRLSTATSLPKHMHQKLAAFTTDDLSAPHLGLSSPAIFDTLQATATLVVHAAWPVNFNIGLASFRPQLAGLRKLLDLAANVPFQKPARLLFTGSVSSAFRMPAGSTVPEGPIAELSYAAPTGYARSKLVGERICDRAAAAAATVEDKGKLPAISINGHDGDTATSSPHVAVIRVGQISADTEHGIWTEKEAIPLLVRGGAQVGALPRLGGRKGRCEWMPVDTAARAITELAARMKPVSVSSASQANGVKGKETNGENGHHPVPETFSSSSALFYNLVAPDPFSWNDDFLPAVRTSGLLRFDEVELPEWLARLRARAVELGDEAEARLPAVQLAEYYSTTYSKEEGHDTEQMGSSAGPTWDVGRACAHSEAVRTCPRAVEAGLVGKMVRNWLEADGMLGLGWEGR
ncbi:NRPS-like enzyme [Apiospora marii]|uniref:NRPS-like enzyme n=1 Tax=Apiospora marii TaxID=335849 RepID=A0ABR1R8C5_9PEZI